MRALISAVVVLGLGCGVGAVPVVERSPSPCDEPLPSAKARLAAQPVTFLLQPGASFGSITARRTLFDDAATGLPLIVRDGRMELEAGLDAYGELLKLRRYEARLADLKFSRDLLPPTGLRLTDVRFNLSAPAELRVHWLGGGAVGTASGTIAVDIHAALRLSSGGSSPLEVGHLEVLPIDVLVQQTEAGILFASATARLDGPLWSWGNLFEFGNLVFAAESNEEGALVELPETATSLGIR